MAGAINEVGDAVIGQHLARDPAPQGDRQQEVLVPDVAVPPGEGDPQGPRQDVLRPLPEGPAPGPSAVPAALARLQRPLPVRLLDPGDDLGQVDTEPGEGVRVGARQPAPAARLGEVPLQRLPDPRRPERRQGEGTPAALPVEEGQQQVLLLDGLGPDPLGVRRRLLDDGTRILREAFEHHCLPYFLCTACLLTPSSAAISCHDQP